MVAYVALSIMPTNYIEISGKGFAPKLLLFITFKVWMLIIIKNRYNERIRDAVGMMLAETNVFRIKITKMLVIK